MSLKAVSIVTDAKSWLNKFVPDFEKLVLGRGLSFECVHDHNQLKYHNIVCFLSYSKIVNQKILERNLNNLVVHASDLPKGKGWSPMSWQILEGKNNIPISLFEAEADVDSGAIYLKEMMSFQGGELVDDLRNEVALKTFSMLERFILSYDSIVKNAKPQEGESSFYQKRGPKDGELNPDKNIRSQFNLFRIADNEAYPAFFYINEKKYVLKIYEG